jgi:hypothetical protein
MEASSAPRRVSSDTAEIAGMIFCRKVVSVTLIFPLFIGVMNLGLRGSTALPSRDQVVPVSSHRVRASSAT